MGYLLYKNVKIKKPVMFICGPYCKKGDTKNRRNILQSKICEIYKDAGKDVIPLIVDEFLDKENVEVSEFSVQLMEEICAALSCETLIFLDTMSAATELGAFANSVYSNTIRVYVPKKSDIHNQGNIGYYVEQAVLNNPNSNIETITYRPRIKLASSSSEFYSEYYYFIKDVVPPNIEEDLRSTVFENVSKLEGQIEYRQTTKESDVFNVIGYSTEGKSITFTTSIRLLFYIVISLIQNEYPNILDPASKFEFDKIDLEKIAKEAKKVYLHSYAVLECADIKPFKDINIVTVCKCSYDEMIKHIAKFAYVYYFKSQYKSFWLVTNSDKVIYKHSLKKHPAVCFLISPADLSLCHDILINPDKYFEKIVIKAKKKREIVKYRDNEDGEKARALHEKIAKSFGEAYKPNQNSYAYIEKRSIKTCVEKHLKSRGFIKLDIKKFFNSITQDNLVETILNHFDIDENFRHRVNDIVASCFYDGKLPLGLCCSPIFSDCYLNAFDKKMEAFASQNGYVYTRYADDIMLSSPNAIDSDYKDLVVSFVRDELEKIDLKINDDKTQAINFDSSHHFMRYVGVNIVEDQSGKSNYLSVGNSYIHDLAKDIISYNQEKEQYQNRSLNKNPNQSQDQSADKPLFYKRVEVIGKIGFIKQIEGDRGVKRLKTRLRKHYPDIDFYDL